MYNLKSITIVGDEMVGESEGLKESRMDVPAFVSIKVRPFLSALRPYIEMKGGYYFLSSCLFGEGALGAEYRIGKCSAVSFGAFAKLIPYPYTGEYKGYKPTLSTGAKLGFSF